MFNGELFQIDPLEHRLPCKTTSPKKYYVRPNTGVVMPRSTCDVIVNMQAQKEAPPDTHWLNLSFRASGVTAKDRTPEKLCIKMVRSKVRYEFIADERTRRETFKKRRTGLLKKLNELKSLCDVEACGVILNMEGTQSETWPSPNEASRVIEKFIAQPSTSHTNKRVDQVGFLKKSLSRISKNLDKETRKVQSLEKELILAERVAKEEVNSGNQLELQDMLRFVEKKIEIVERRLAEMKF